MATLSIINNFSLDSFGLVETGKQGLAASAFADEYDITVTGTVHRVKGVIATATAVTVYDDDNDVPADWDYLWYWADVVTYIQFIGSGSNVIFKCAAYQPFVLPGYDSLLAAADTTAITGSEPTLTDIDSVVIGNYTGGSGNFVFAVID